MSVESGSRIGQYEIVAAIGAGGMGEVYRARDTQLNRDVAIKVLPEVFASDPERLARFEREAQTLAALNHPHIAQIYGVEGRGSTRALVMELVEGEDLAARLRRGPIPLDEALRAAVQIADALEAAHERGVIHRDLKPANITVREDGTVKVLDFGLAKAIDPPGTAAGALANSPTITSPLVMTHMGVILGTAAYMSPEQARGRAADKRSDIWAFGCVLFEMLTGRQAFKGDSVTDLIAAIVKDDPDWNAIPADVPQSVRRLIRRCLRRDARQRLHDIGDARTEIEEAITAPAPDEAARPRAAAGRRSRATIILAAVLASFVLTSGYLAWLVARPAAPPPVIRFIVNTPPGADMGRLSWPMAVLSPDGTQLAVAAGRGAEEKIYLRSIDAVEMRALEGTKYAYNPFFSPDGKWLAFTADQKMKRVPVAGGQPHDICETEWGGGSWGPGDVIVFTQNYASGLWKVPASGGKPEKLTDPDPKRGELGHWWPQFLPDGKHIVFTSFSTPIEKSRVMLYDVETGAQRVLVEGANYGRVLASGHLVYARANGIVGVPFDVRRLQIAGPEAPVLDGVSTYFTNGVAQVSVSPNGTLAFIPEKEASANSELVWVDRKGTVTSALPARRRLSDPRLSPDGRRVALTIEDATRDIWMYDFDRGVLGRVTSGAASEFQPVWTADGRKIVFASEQPVFQIFMKPPVGTAPDEPLVRENHDATPQATSPDGKYLVYTLSSTTTRLDLWIRPLGPGSEAKKLVATNFLEDNAAISPDGRWMAYTSDESGRPEVYVQAFPEPSERWQVSSDGATLVRWSHDGRELFYAAGPPERLVAVPIAARPGGSLAVGKPSTVFEGRFEGYDVGPDGRILLLRRDPNAPPPSVHVVMNWFQELRTKLPHK